ncbi:hypothetical protein [Streptomyces sp. NPDC127033]
MHPPRRQYPEDQATLLARFSEDYAGAVPGIRDRAPQVSVA